MIYVGNHMYIFIQYDVRYNVRYLVLYRDISPDIWYIILPIDILPISDI